MTKINNIIREGMKNIKQWVGDLLYLNNDLEAHIKTLLTTTLENEIEELEGKKVEEGQTEQCKDVMEMNYLIGKNKGYNTCLSEIIKNKKEILKLLTKE